MKNILAMLFARLSPGFGVFGPSKRTVDGALIHFNRALEELEAVEQQENAEAARHEQTLAETAAALNSSRKEAARARNKRAKIANLIGDDEDVEEGVQSLRQVGSN